MVLSSTAAGPPERGNGVAGRNVLRELRCFGASLRLPRVQKRSMAASAASGAAAARSVRKRSRSRVKASANRSCEGSSAARCSRTAPASMRCVLRSAGPPADSLLLMRDAISPPPIVHSRATLPDTAKRSVLARGPVRDRDELDGASDRCGPGRECRPISMSRTERPSIDQEPSRSVRRCVSQVWGGSEFPVAPGRSVATRPARASASSAAC